MIRHLPPHELLLREVEGHPYLAASIGGRAACPQPQQDFWATEGQGGFLCREGETLYACGALPPEELTEFALGIGFCRLITDRLLPLAQGASLLAMAYGGEPPRCSGHPGLQLYHGGSADFSSVDFAGLQRESHALATREETQRYAVSLSREIRGGGGVALCLRQDGRLVAGGTLIHGYRHSILLEAVAVLPQYRGRGLGSAIVTAACGYALGRGRLPLLCCHPALAPLYEKAGFVPDSPIYAYEPHMKGQPLK